MKLQVKLFAAARQIAGRDDVEIELTEPATVADVRSELLARAPQLASVLRHAVFAVNTEYARESTPVGTASEVACIPPVSGG